MLLSKALIARSMSFIMVGLAIIFIKHAELILKQERHEVSEELTLTRTIIPTRSFSSL